MELSVIILNYKMRGLVKNCVKAILESNLNVPYEIIVVDNNSKDGLEEFLKEKFPSVRFIQTGKNLGMGAGNNAGIRAAQGEHIAILNPDIFVFPDSLTKLLEYLKANPDVGLVAPKLLNPDRGLQYTCYRWHKFWTPLFRRTALARLWFAKKELARFLMNDWQHETTREVDWIQGSCWLLPKKVFDEIGFFDERFFMYFEDTDFCRRVHQAGKKIVYLAEAAVIHLHRRQSADGGLGNILTNRLTRIHIKSWLKYMLKWRETMTT
ncbi:glycosyltransferase family 2 protein [Candidatus Falkowbacteria bacterium]|nr:glycosyltransferase family 2 protein [Candidatus Falkowbacteria bacterium]